MSFVVVMGIFALVLFLFAFITKSRFGLLGLALAAGSVISTLLSGQVAMQLQQAGVQLTAPPLSSVVTVVITIAPAVLLLRSAGRYNGPVLRIVGSILFALLAISLMLEAIKAGLVIDGVGRTIYDNLAQYHGAIIAGSLLYATVEMFLKKSPKPSKDTDKH